MRGDRTMCTEMTSDPLMRSVLPTRTAPPPGLRRGQVRTPGDDLHFERERVAGETRAKAAEPDDAERFAGEAHADGHAALETAGAHGPVGGGYRAGGGDHQSKRQFGGRVGGAGCGGVLQTVTP